MQIENNSRMKYCCTSYVVCLSKPKLNINTFFARCQTIVKKLANDSTVSHGKAKKGKFNLTTVIHSTMYRARRATGHDG